MPVLDQPHQRSVLRRLVQVLALGLLALGVLSLAGASGAQENVRDARERRSDARDEQVRLARELDLLEAEAEELHATLAALDEAIAGQQAIVESARQAVIAAEDEARYWRGEADRTGAMADTLRARSAELAIDSYLGAASGDDGLLRGDDFNAAVQRQAVIGEIRGGVDDVLDQLRAAAEDQRIATEKAQAALDLAEARRQELAQALADVQDQRAVQEGIEAELRGRIDDYAGQVAALEATEADMTAFIRQAEAAASARAAAAAGNNAKPPPNIADGEFIRPVDASPGSPFGNRRHPVLGYVRLHAGVDFGAPSGAAIWAANGGTVIHAGTRGGYGNTVMISHGNGITTLYAHMSSISVSNGQEVSQGQQVGRVGSTGLSTGPHLHFEVRVNGTPKNPMLYIN